MNLNHFIQKSSNIFGENRLLKFVVVVMGVTLFFNTLELRSILNTERTVVVPVGFKNKIEVSSTSASDEFIKVWARYVADLALNYTPPFSRAQFSEMLTLYAPESYPAAKRTFYDLADKIETSQATSSYFISDIRLNSKNQVLIMGLKREFVQDNRIDEQQKSYLLDFDIRDGQFKVLKFSPKEPT